MHKLCRGNLEVACLNEFRIENANWDAVSSECKKKIWEALDQMQAGFCAFCEIRLESNFKHIEHFISRSNDPQRTFDFHNLFGSCGVPGKVKRNSRCGTHKDNAPTGKNYQYSELLKPDEVDASCYLLFLSNGRVVANPDLSPGDKNRAEETIRVFNLDCCPELVNRRKTAMRSYDSLFEELEEVFNDSTITDSEKLELYEDEVPYFNQLEFQTAIRQLWDHKKP